MRACWGLVAAVAGRGGGTTEDESQENRAVTSRVIQQTFLRLTPPCANVDLGPHLPLQETAPGCSFNFHHAPAPVLSPGMPETTDWRLSSLPASWPGPVEGFRHG